MYLGSHHLKLNTCKRSSLAYRIVVKGWVFIRTSMFYFINKTKKTKPRSLGLWSVTLNLVNVFMYQINFLMYDREKDEKFHYSSSRPKALLVEAGYHWFTHCSWANSVTCLRFVKPLRIYISSRNDSGLWNKIFILGLLWIILKLQNTD